MKRPTAPAESPGPGGRKDSGAVPGGESAGEAGGAYGRAMKRFTRHLLFVKPASAARHSPSGDGGLIVIFDRLEAPKPSTFEWLLHAIENPFTIDGQTLTWAGTGGRAVVRFLEPAGLVISQTDQFDVPPADWGKIPWAEWHLTAQAPEKIAQERVVDAATLQGATDCLAVEMGSVAGVGARTDVHDQADPVLLDQREERLQVMVGMPDREDGDVPAHAACPSSLLDGRACPIGRDARRSVGVEGGRGEKPPTKCTRYSNGRRAASVLLRGSGIHALGDSQQPAHSASALPASRHLAVPYRRLL